MKKLVYCVKSPFTLIVIPGLTRNPVFPGWIPAFAEILMVQFILHWQYLLKPEI